ALVQCTARTQAGWMTFALVDVACSSLTVRADMAGSRLQFRIGLYARNRVSVTAMILSDRCMAGIEFTKRRAGLPRLASPTRPVGTSQARAGIRTPAKARCRPHGSH